MAIIQTSRSGRWLVPLIIAAVVVTLDQATKIWVAATLGPEIMARFIPVIGDTVRIAYHHNTGVAFSLFQGYSSVLILTSLLIVAGAIYFYATQLPNHRRLIQLSMGLIMGGAFGNLIDRIRLGYVVDFIQVGWFPIFNVADSAITVGAALLMVQFVGEEISQRRDQRAVAQQ